MASSHFYSKVALRFTSVKSNEKKKKKKKASRSSQGSTSEAWKFIKCFRSRSHDFRYPQASGTSIMHRMWVDFFHLGESSRPSIQNSLDRNFILLVIGISNLQLLMEKTLILKFVLRFYLSITRMVLFQPVWGGNGKLCKSPNLEKCSSDLDGFRKADSTLGL